MAQRGFGGFGDYSNLGNFANNAFSRLRGSSSGGGFAGFASDAVKDLGLGDMLQNQAQGDTDELRKKRLRDQQALMGSMGSLASYSLFGARGGTES